MDISYRMKKKELIFLLDLCGDVNSLEQRFGNVYISSDEHKNTARRLDEKGLLIVSGNKAVTDNAAAGVIERFYLSPLVLASEKLDIWLYCSADMVLAVRMSSLFAYEFVLTPLFDDDISEFITENETSFFTVFRGGDGKVLNNEAAAFIRGYRYGQ